MKRVAWSLLAAVTLVSLVAERFAHHKHHYWFHDIPGFFVLYGFVGCVAIVLLSKWFGKTFVQRDEDYYTVAAPDDAPGGDGVS